MSAGSGSSDTGQVLDDRSTRAHLAGERLARRYRSRRSAADLERLVAFYRPMVIALAGRYARGDRREDLEQVACVGLIKAAHRFDPERGSSFRSYAIPMILGEVKRFWRDNGWALHVPRPVQERMLQVRAAGSQFEQTHARPATVAELASLVGCSDEEVVDALAAGDSMSALSLDLTAVEPEGLTLAEQVGGDDAAFDYVDCIESIKTVLPGLSRLEREVVRLRFQQELTQREIGEELGIPARRVGTLLSGALDQLAEMLDGEAAPALAAA